MSGQAVVCGGFFWPSSRDVMALVLSLALLHPLASCWSFMLVQRGWGAAEGREERSIAGGRKARKRRSSPGWWSTEYPAW